MDPATTVFGVHDLYEERESWIAGFWWSISGKFLNIPFLGISREFLGDFYTFLGNFYTIFSIYLSMVFEGLSSWFFP